MDARTRWLSFFALLLAVAGALPAQGGSAPKLTLEAEFKPPVVKPGEEATLVLTAQVAAGFHAYGTREQTNVPVSLPAKDLQRGRLELVGDAVIPPGNPHATAIGMSFPLPNTFVVQQKVRVPADMAGGEAKVTGSLGYQVCDENMCLPPAKAPFDAVLTVQSGAQDPVPGTKPGLKLVADEKFVVKASFDPATVGAGGTTTLVLEVTVDERYHAYGSREETSFPVKLDETAFSLGGLEVAEPAIVPPGEPHESAVGTEYRLPHEFRVTQRLRVPAEAKPGPVTVKGVLDYMVCDENSCDPPGHAAFEAKVEISATAVGSGSGDGGAFGGSLWALILACIGGGLFALAMPCTYPMIPITFSFFTKQAEKRGGNVLPLALVYGLGIVLMFVVVGASLSGVIIGIVNHWATNVVIGAMFLFFAFVLFGWINLQPPQFVQRAAGKASATGGYLGVFFMGATLVITSFTCTAPIVGSLLANVAKFGVGRVAFGMGIFGLTMALPFVVLSLMPSKVKAMPRSGEWMETLKVSLGFVELAAALKFLSMVDFAFGWQILPRELFLMWWTTIFGLWALYLFGILRKAGTPSMGVSNGRMAAGMAVSLLATYFLFGALGFRLDFYTTNFIPGYSAESVLARHSSEDGGTDGGGKHVVGRHRIVLDDEPAAVALARTEDKLLLYNFTGFN